MSIIRNNQVSLKSQGLTSFVEQDLNYLFGYESWVQDTLTQSCAMESPTTCAGPYGTALSGRLKWTEEDGQWYEGLFGVQRKNPNFALASYAEFYKRQKTCADAVSSMMVCLCSYGLLAKNIHKLKEQNFFVHHTDQEKKMLDAFVEFNGDLKDPAWSGLEEGTACAYGRSILETLGQPLNEQILAEALKHEQVLWSVPVHNEL